MSRRRKRAILAVGLCAVLAMVVVLGFSSLSQPRHGGKTLRQWLNVELNAQTRARKNAHGALPTSVSGDVAAQRAIRDMGSDCVPHLIRMLTYRVPEWKATLANYCSRYRLFKWDPTERKLTEGRLAFAGFASLGPDELSAVPPLVMLTKHADPSVRIHALSVIAQVGYDDPSALNGLVSRLSDSDSNVRSCAASCLSTWHKKNVHQRRSRASSAVPALIAASDDPNPSVLKIVYWALDDIDPSAAKSIRHKLDELKTPSSYYE